MNEVAAVVAAFAGTLAFLVNLVTVIVAIYKLGRAVEKFEMIGTQQSTEISSLKVSINGIAELVTKMALQTQRLDNISGRVSRTEQLIDDLRRGEGMIIPFKGAHEVP